MFERLTALDAIGPYEVLSRLPGAEVFFVAAEPGSERTDTLGAAGVFEGLDEVARAVQLPRTRGDPMKRSMPCSTDRGGH